MYSRCPTCRSLYRLHLKVAESQGILYCRNCQNVFDSLDSLEAGEPDPDKKALLEETVHTYGDRQVARHYKIPLAEIWRPIPSPVIDVDAADLNPKKQSGQTQIHSGISISGYLLRGYVGLALRNLMRNRRRSLLALAAIGFGVVSILLAGGFIEWVLWSMREAEIQAQLGHFQVVKRGYFAHGAADPFAYLLPLDDPALSLVAKSAEVQVVAPRLYFSGLISRNDTTVSFVGQGVDPDKEAVLSKEVHIRTGKNLSKNDENGLIIGAGLAENLGAKVGEKLVLLVTTQDGGINAIDAKVNGIFYTATKAFDDVALRLNIGTARSLLRAEGNHVGVVLLDSTERTDAVLERIRREFAGNDKYEFIAWYELADFYNKTVKLFSQQVRLVWLVIGLLILLSISNTLTMSVLERTSEIGTMMALGLRRERILKLFLNEGLLLGLTGGLLGVAVGWTLAILISYVGIPMPPPPGMDVGFTAEILVTKPLAASGLTMAVVATTLAAVYPALKASRLEIVNALRHNR